MKQDAIVVTGATGFVGTALLECLVVRGSAHVRAVNRSASSILPPSVEQAVVGDIDERPEWKDALTGVDVVVHLAARVYVMRERAADSLAWFRRTSVSGSLRLAEAAAGAGVRRFVYLSSIKVNGEGGTHSELDLPAPTVRRGIPLPLGAIHNRRSLVALGNLEDFIITCIEHPAAAVEEGLHRAVAVR